MSDQTLEGLLEEGEATVASPASLEQITNLAEKAEQLSSTIEHLEDALKAQKGELHELKTKALPDAMTSVGLSEFTMESGTTLKLEDFVAGTLPKKPEEKEVAIRHLEELEAEGIIKNTMTVRFSKAEHNMAGMIADDLRSQGYEVELTSGVAPQTYLKFVRDALKNGDPIDLEKLGIFSGRQVKIKMLKGDF